MQKLGKSNIRFSKKCGKPSILGIFDHFGSNFGQTRPKISNILVLLIKQKRHFFTLPKTSIHAKIREIQYAVFLKMRKTLDFGHF